MSEENKGVPQPKCLTSIPRAALLTLRALWTHRRWVAHYLRTGDTT